jgi:hypothetical protein
MRGTCVGSRRNSSQINQTASFSVPNWKQQKALSGRMRAMVAKIKH